jgi:hypothetical protein
MRHAWPYVAIGAIAALMLGIGLAPEIRAWWRNRRRGDG